MKKNRLLYALLLILSYSFVYFYGGKVPYLLFYVTLMLPVVSFAYTLVIYLRFKYSEDIDKRMIMKGDKINFLFSVHNEDFFLYPYLKVVFYGSETIFAKQFQIINFSLAPRNRKTFSFELECKYRGSYDIGIQSVEIEDFLGIFKLSYKSMEPKWVNVYPRIVYLDRFDIKTDFSSETYSVLNSRYEDSALTSDIRKYAYGDNYRKIHWKLTAKANELMVKNSQGTSETSATLVLDLKRNNFGVEVNTIVEDKVIECVVAVAHYCLSRWVPINFLYFKDRLVNLEAKSPLDFEELYALLSKISFTEKLDVKDILDIYINEHIGRTNLLVFTSSVDYELYNQMYKARFLGYEAGIIYVSPEEMTGRQSPEIESMLSHLTEIGVAVYKINLNDDIKLILERQNG